MSIGGQVEALAVAEAGNFADTKKEIYKKFFEDIEKKINIYKAKVITFIEQEQSNINATIYQSTLQALDYKTDFSDQIKTDIYRKYAQQRNQFQTEGLINQGELQIQNIMQEGYSLLLGIRQEVAKLQGKDGSINYKIAFPAPGGESIISGILTEDEYLKNVNYNLNNLSLQFIGLNNFDWKTKTYRTNANRYNQLMETGLFSEDTELSRVMKILQDKKNKSLRVLRKNVKKGQSRRASVAVANLKKGRQFEIAEELIYYITSQGKQLSDVSDGDLVEALIELLPTSVSNEFGKNKINVFDNLAFYRGGDVNLMSETGLRAYQLKYAQTSAHGTALSTILTGLNEILTGIHATKDFMQGQSAKDISNSTMVAKIRGANIDQRVSDFAIEYVSQILGL